MPRLIFALLIPLLLAVGNAPAAPIYKWRDASGTIHYEDTPPPKGEVQVIRAPTPYRGEAAQGSQENATASADPAAQEAAAKRAAKCAESREGLAQAESAERMYELDDQGVRRYLSDDEVKAHIAELKASVASWCEGQ